ncbi:3-deoxy-7-phosphoheptulonate synthase [Desulfoferrobacter suflitae]|uniref:3-deoxy-7-phosphoheptulonate synthase n=1 Tax=Desulfoferrobacter suflitae TaxID=2865782 RepID=UPI002164D060|nr:3-deoxy-7-phosphoheptulonate synthase [Desulfoferrobacter suflitae]MCK8602496.1 3-deoxy-7-phosphoheptulonate synthase [Desulfoferrobacter suflitae]
MKPTHDIHVKEFIPLVSPNTLKEELPLSSQAYQTVVAGRGAIQKILRKQDRRLLVIVGPCSIHDEKAAIEYAERLAALKEKVKDTLYLVMRVYFEKPRTTIGWKGLINDPWLDGSCDIVSGLRIARSLLLRITEMGLATATEMLDPITPQYIAGLVCWAAIGARTIESQTHREMSSGLSMPVGFKNCTDGGLATALNAMIAAGSPQSFLGIDQNGQTCIVTTTGNPDTHLVLRGGKRPNYDSVSIQEALGLLREKGLAETIMVDCSHANSRKKHRAQAMVWQDVINQRIDGNDALIGLMLESNLFEGNQENKGDLAAMKYGVSISDACISWETTEHLIMSAHEQLERHFQKEPISEGSMNMPRYRVA